MLYVYWLIGMRDLNGNVCREEKEKELSFTRGGDTQTQEKEGRPAKEEAANRNVQPFTN